MSPDPDAAEPLIIEAFKFRHFIVLNTEMAIRSSDMAKAVTVLFCSISYKMTYRLYSNIIYYQNEHNFHY